jgi:RHS repeat-associated protein
MKLRVRRLASFVLPMTLAMGFGAQPLPQPPAPYVHPDGQRIASVPVARVPVGQDRPVGATMLSGAVPNAGWPSGAAAVSVGSTQDTSTVRVEFLDRKASERAGVAGVLLRVDRTDRATLRAQIPVRVDYRGFRNLFGADWASRLHLVALPECGLTTPQIVGCQGVPVPSSNDVKAGAVSTTASLAPGGSTVLALEAGAAGPAGSFAATPIAPAASWQAGAGTGDFTWSYPLRMPPSLGGAAPTVSFNYSSQAVDGRTAATNNQPSMIGEGFEYSPGYVERRYKACTDDMGGTANNGTQTGDLCWGTENVVMSLGGSAVELTFSPVDNRWHQKKEDGTRIERLTDTGLANGDDSGEYWKATTVDGTQYFFGRNRLPSWSTGRPETRSTWTVPVAGNNPGESCYHAAFVDSFCNEAWRWNLDYVIDPNLNTMSYWYAPETNFYGRANDATRATAYIRGGMLSRIDYGTRTDNAFGTAPVQVVFEPADRCSTTTGCDPAVQANWANWLDTPLDQGCQAGATCTGNLSPTFWSTKRLAKVTTQVWGGSAYRPVDSWSLRASWPQPTDGNHAGLWLAGITHTGLVGGEVSLPETVLTGTAMHNRVDTPSDNIFAYAWMRLTSIRTETGGLTSIFYSDRDCVAGSRMPASPDSNTLRCFPVKWQPEGFGQPVTDYFHKYVVTAVTENDLTGASPAVKNYYEYLGDPGWHRDYDDGLVKADNLTWAQWRGYGGLRVRHGDGTEQTRTETTFFRGMDGDVRADGSARAVSLGSADGDPAVPDAEAFTGMVREELTYDADTVIAGTVSTPWQSAPTASRTINGVTTNSRFANTQTIRSRTRLDHAPWWRHTTKTIQYDDLGLPVQIDDSGDEAVIGSATVTGDESCTKTTYARNPTAWIMNRSTRTEQYGRPCSVAPATAADVLGVTRTYYDGATTDGAAPMVGNPTRVDTLASWTSPTVLSFVTDRRAHYDAYGRADQAFDLAGAKRITTYDTVSGGGVTKVTTSIVVDSTFYTTFVELDPARGNTTASVDLNGNRSEITFDPLGRTTGVWLPGRSRTLGANTVYDYGMRTDGTAWTRTRVLNAAGNYVTRYTLLDSLLRERQTQSQSATAGHRTIIETRYDSAGRPVLKLGPFVSDGAPSGDLVTPVDATLVYQQTRTTYDQAGRVTATIVQPRGVEAWRTSTRYGGDHVETTPPAGGTATSVVTDALGRTVALKQYATGAPVDSGTTTTYTYDRKGALSSVTDTAGNTWQYTNDVRGRQIQSRDPDRGDTTYTYDTADRVATVTDARGAAFALKYTYDGLGRQTGVYDKATNAKRVTYTYDTLPGGKGAISSASRWIGSAEYKTAVRGYTVRGQSTGTVTTLPSAEGVLAGDYSFIIGYNTATDGSLAGYTYGSRGDLAAETVFYTYDPITGLPVSMDSDFPGTNAYVKSTSYTGLGQVSGFVLTTDKRGTTNVYRDYAYDLATGRLEHSTTTRSAGAVVSDPHYGYDPRGNLTRISDPLGGGTADTQCFQQDYLKRLTGAWTASDGDCAIARRTIANIGGPAPYWQSWTYDGVGNRLSQTDHAAAGDAVTDFHTPAGKHALASTTGAVVGSYGYDTVGNMQSRPAAAGAQTMAWDAEGHLTSITQGTATTSFIYSADGSRLLRKEAATTTLYLGGVELRLTNATGAIAETRCYAWSGQVIAQRTTAGVAWVVNDHQGTANIVIDAATQQVTLRYQTPFGGTRGPPPPSWPNQRGFVGGQQDPTGLTHLGAREYDPGTGRFISLDPLLDNTDPQQMQGYAYANNSPVSSSDPSGLRFIEGSEAATTSPEPWWERFREAHETAVQMRVKAIQAKWPGANVTIRMGDNVIPGGSSRDNGNVGYADIICWDCDPEKVYIWEVKHAGGAAEAAGPEQLTRYVKQLQIKIDGDTNSPHRGRTVEKGPTFGYEQTEPNRSNPNEQVTVRDGDEPGIQVYTTKEDDKENQPAPTPTATATVTATAPPARPPVSQQRPTPSPSARTPEIPQEDPVRVEVPEPVKVLVVAAVVVIAAPLIVAAVITVGPFSWAFS